MLWLHLDTWATYQPDVLCQMRFVIVDDGSPEPAEPIVRDALARNREPFQIWLFRVDVDMPWAWDHARNVAMHHIPAGEWALLTDIDHLLTEPNARRLAEGKLKSGNFYIPSRRRAVDGQPYKAHPNSFVIQKELFWKAGGYEEMFVGYYGKDSCWNRQLDTVIGAKRCPWPELELLLYGREVIPDASTSTLGRKGTSYHLGTVPALSRRKREVHVHRPTKHLTLPYHRVM